MPFHARSVAMLLAAAVALPAWAGERPGHASVPRLCPDDAPEGVRLPPRPNCKAAPRRAAKADDGFRDLGGVRLRIGGRVGAEYGLRR